MHLTTRESGVIRVVITSKNIPITPGFRCVGGGRLRALEGRDITDENYYRDVKYLLEFLP